MTIAISPERVIRDLFDKRHQWIQSSRENGFEEGIHNLLTQLYPDKAHFIYELLQNAEDAQATHVHFQLQDDRLIVEHDGKRLFNARDIDSITNIGQSTKKDDVNQIGKFGIGFKAVFAYTISPQVHSGDYHFEIRDLVCPHHIPPQSFNQARTCFVFPFNHPHKSREACFRETQEGLNDLADSTLLFLNNICHISWQIQNQEICSLKRQVVDDRVIEITARAGTSYWLRFQQAVQSSSALYVAIAFRLGFRKADQKHIDLSVSLSDQMKIIPVDGKLHIFFPADRETTRLKFHLHGPYASTVARDSIPHTADNGKLLKETAELVAHSLEQIKRLRLLTIDFLDVLPNNEDGLDEFYRPIQESIIGAMRKSPLVPTSTGGHAPASLVLQSLQNIRRVIGVQELPFFTGKQNGKWAAGVLKNSRQDRFLQSLDIPSWEWDDLRQAVHELFQEGCQQQQHVDWLTQQPDEWLHTWYDLLYDAERLGKTWWCLQDYPIIRTQKDEHRRSIEVFFPIEKTGSLTDALPRVKPSVLSGSSPDRNTRVQKFLEDIGVRAVGEREEIQLILDTFYTVDGKDVSNRQHKQHIERFVAWWKNSSDAEIFMDYCIFIDASQDYYRRPDDFYLDQSFQETGLSAVAGVAGFPSHALWEGYVKLKGFVAFAKAVGVIHQLDFKKTYIPGTHPDAWDDSGKWSHHGIDEDWTIQCIDELLKSHQQDISLLVWNTMAQAAPQCLQARYRSNAQCSIQSHPSTLVYKLREHAWIPDKHGKFRTPTAMTRDLLPEGFTYDDRNGWLSAIGFGADAQEDPEGDKELLEQAAKLGLTSEFVDVWKRVDPAAREVLSNEFVTLIQRQKPIPASSPSGNPDRRRDKAKEQAKSAPPVERTEKERTIRPSQHYVAPTEYLIANESNEEKGVICQICGDRMPFKYTPAGDDAERDYFEAVQFIRSVKKEYEANHLALCPNCAAEYKYACKTPEAERVALVRALHSNCTEDALVITLELSTPRSLRFTQCHLIDLQAALEADDEGGM